MLVGLNLSSLAFCTTALYPSLIHNFCTSVNTAQKTIGSLRYMHHSGDSKVKVKKAIGLISKTTTVHQHHTLRYISLLSPDSYDVKFTHVMLYG